MELTPAIDFEKKKNKTRLYLSICGFDYWPKLPLAQIVLVSLALELFAIISPLFMQFVVDDVLTTKDTSLLYVLAIGLACLLLSDGDSYVRSWVIMFLSNV